MMNVEFLERLRNRIATSAVGPSKARSMGPTGTVGKARNALRSIDLHRFEVRKQSDFESALEEATLKIKRKLPRGAQHWGSSRKFLNIFLRDCVYSRHICDGFDLLAIEPWLEVPLDRHVATGLALESGSEVLPRWKTVIGLTQEISKRYQEFAEESPKRKGSIESISMCFIGAVSTSSPRTPWQAEAGCVRYDA